MSSLRSIERIYVKIQVAWLVRSCSSGKVLEGPSLRCVVRQENLPASLNRAYRARMYVIYVFTYKTRTDDRGCIRTMHTPSITHVADLSVDIFSGDFYYVLIFSRIHFADARLPTGRFNERARDTRIAWQNLPCV